MCTIKVRFESPHSLCRCVVACEPARFEELVVGVYLTKLRATTLVEVHCKNLRVF